MRIMVKPPSPAPSPPLPAGALVTLRVEAADPSPLLSGPPSVAYEGRWTPHHSPAPAFLFPQKDPAPGVSTGTAAHSTFRTPFATPSSPHVDIPAHEGDRVMATLITPAKTYSAALTAPATPLHPNTAPVELTLAEGGAAPPGPPPTPQPAPGLTITPDPGDPDVLNLDPAPGNDNIVVVN